NVSEVDAEVELTDWEANRSAVEVVAAVGMEDACVVEAATILVSEGVGEVVVVTKVDALT
ncbi:hypothetical protein KI387_029659, partial [Taxus chinensis]